MQRLAECLLRPGLLDEAEKTCREYIELMQEVQPTDDVKIAGAILQLAGILGEQSRLPEAESCYQKTLQLNADRSAHIALYGREMLARMLHAQGRLDEAVDMYRGALAVESTMRPDPESMEEISACLEIALQQQKEANVRPFYKQVRSIGTRAILRKLWRRRRK
jgi:tetratricopeptide (TPR) repeat protein